MEDNTENTFIESKKFTEQCDKEVTDINEGLYSQRGLVRIQKIVDALQRKQYYADVFEQVTQGQFYKDLFKNIEDNDYIEVQNLHNKEFLFIARNTRQQRLMKNVLNYCGAGRYEVILEPPVPQPNYQLNRS